MNKLSGSGSLSAADVGRACSLKDGRWLWLDSGFPALGRAGGGISDADLLILFAGTNDGCLELLRVDTNLGFGVEVVPR